MSHLEISTPDDTVMEDPPPPSKFSWSRKMYHLTYKTHLPWDEFDEFFRRVVGVRKVPHWSFVHENADENDKYEHTHFAFALDSAGMWKDAGKFDFLGVHPNAKAILSDEHWNHTMEYHKKAPVGDSLNQGPPRLPAVPFHDSVIDYLLEYKGPIQSVVTVKGPIGAYCARNMKWAAAVLGRRPVKNRTEGIVLRPWQLTVEEICQRDSEDRTIHWICDSIGNVGKSIMCLYLVERMNAFVFTPGAKLADVAHAYEGQSIVICDITRKFTGEVPYEIFESFKNGQLFSSKYESRMLRFEPPHVLVFSNHTPDHEALSSDRWNIINLDIINQVPLTYAPSLSDFVQQS